MLRIFDDIEETYELHDVYYDKSSGMFWMVYDMDDGSSGEIISGIYTAQLYTNAYMNILTKRPDGTWYALEFWSSYYGMESRHKLLHDLLQSGLEPWRAFEVVAL